MAPFKLPPNGKAIADITVSATVNKSRKPKFELHLKIYDLNNVPLVSGVSSIKWHLPNSLHNEHRGRTPKEPIANHRVDYNYSKIVPLRLVIDRNNRLSDCPIEFEISQEFETLNASRDEKVLLGKVSLNLAEYVAESEAILRNNRPATAESPFTAESPGGWHVRSRSSISTKGTLSSLSTTESNTSANGGGGSGSGGGAVSATAGGSSAASASTPGVEDGVTRRYLLQDSKINSTLKISILMVQVDGERNFIAPTLKSAAVFGGITGIIAGGDMASSADKLVDDDSSVSGVVGALMSTSISKGHETAEIQDVYRRALAASWACQSGELPADECIEDIFSGGDGFRTPSHGSDTGLTSAAATRHGGPRGLPHAGNSMASALHRTNWSPSSPTHSSICEGEEEEDGSSITSKASSGGKKHGSSRILPRLGPIRRKTQPTQGTSGRVVSSGSSHKSKFRDGDVDAGYMSSGEDAGSNTSGSLHQVQVHGDDESETSIGHHGTLRPRDFFKFHGPGSSSKSTSSSSASASALAALRFPNREESSFSDRTVMPSYMDAEVPRSSSSYRSGHGRNGSYDNGSRVPFGHDDRRSRVDGRLGGGGGGGRSGSGGGRMPVGSRQNSSSGRDEHGTRRSEVNEYEVRDDFVAWQLPAAGTESVTAS